MVNILAFFYLVCQRKLFVRNIFSIQIFVISAPWYFEESAHFADTVFIPVFVYDLIFDCRLNFFPVSERKSRINSTSGSNRLIYLSLLANTYLIWASLSSFSIEGGISPFFTRSSLFFQRFACFHYYLLLIVPCFEVLYFVVCKSELVSYFSESITLIYHTDDFCFIFTYMSIFSAHKNDLLWYR